MKVRFTMAAEAELDEAQAWYVAMSARLGEAFVDEIHRAGALISEFPNAWHPLGEGVRRIRLNRFPYGLVYVVEHDEVLILAVAHLHREPDCWRHRRS